MLNSHNLLEIIENMLYIYMPKHLSITLEVINSDMISVSLIGAVQVLRHALNLNISSPYPNLYRNIK
jgi:hypothetical protein